MLNGNCGLSVGITFIVKNRITELPGTKASAASICNLQEQNIHLLIGKMETLSKMKTY